ncbi:MAG: outer membrane lipid asymmetry maintenance protein MlaD [bacterium]
MNEDRAVDLSVGIILILGFVALAYMSLSFGNLNLFGSGRYEVKAVFSKVNGLNENTGVEMLGIKVGTVEKIWLENYKAHVTLAIDRDVTLPEGTIASIQTEGLLGEKYIALSPGGMPGNIAKDGTGQIRQTNPPLILEDLIGNLAFGKAGSE